MFEGDTDSSHRDATCRQLCLFCGIACSVFTQQCKNTPTASVVRHCHNTPFNPINAYTIQPQQTSWVFLPPRTTSLEKIWQQRNKNPWKRNDGRRRKKNERSAEVCRLKHVLVIQTDTVCSLKHVLVMQTDTQQLILIDASKSYNIILFWTVWYFVGSSEVSQIRTQPL